MIYLDSSALIKLVHGEAESPALEEWIVAHHGPRHVTSELARLEVIRACRRHFADALPHTRAHLGSLDVVALTADIIEDAAEMGDPWLRSLDAIHLASALAIREELTGFVTYDRRLFDAAKAEGLDPVRPGA
ncbi:type II toxin-antitoxin system VapC family toxin [Actinopolymorpha sp. B17G11]|uniref:type II toxin-antitoxin system VapC family toxin n=1 Tax=unclassified Actinopolymorpha TaxID=2627063 RepID=UPI0032D9A083